ncbi:MAG: cysteine desulfurase family protein [Minisyncoccia bacterium]
MTRIYADAAAATPLSPAARKELLRLLDVFGNAGALHHEAVAAKKELEAARKKIAGAIGAHPDEIIFTASGTEGNNLAIQGILRPLIRSHLAARSSLLHAITSAIEHQSVLEPLRALAAEGLEVTELPVDAEGLVSQKALAEAIRDETVFVSVQLVNSEVGTIEPIRDLARQIRHARKERGADALPLIFHTDASQAPFWIDIQVDALGVDLLTLDGQKVQGPKGVGALYVRRQTTIESQMRGGVQEFNLRAGTPNVPLAGSFAVALAEAQDKKKLENRKKKVAAVRDHLWKEIKKMIPDAIANGPAFATARLLARQASSDHRVANNLNVSIAGLDGEAAVIALDAFGVAASTRSACNTGDEEPSHVIKALGVPKALSKTAVRFTLLPTATKAEGTQIAAALKKACDLYRARE